MFSKIGCHQEMVFEFGCCRQEEMMVSAKIGWRMVSAEIGWQMSLPLKLLEVNSLLPIPLMIDFFVRNVVLEYSNNNHSISNNNHQYPSTRILMTMTLMIFWVVVKHLKELKPFKKAY